MPSNQLVLQQGARVSRSFEPAYRSDLAPDEALRSSLRHSRAVYAAVLIGLVAAAALLVLAASTASTGKQRPKAALPPNVDSAHFVASTLLLPALDRSSVPFRWIDPRPSLRCGPGTTVQVNGEPLVAGAVVPVQPFVFEWQIDGCHTAHGFGLRLNGGVQLTVYREEWGLSAMVDPVDLRVAMQGFATTSIRRGGAALVNDNEMAEPKTLEGIERVAIKPHGRSPCC